MQGFGRRQALGVHAGVAGIKPWVPGVVPRERWRLHVVCPAPEVHLLRAVFLRGLLLI